MAAARGTPAEESDSAPHFGTCDDYYASVNIRDYDETIVGHPYMEQIKAAIVAAVAIQGERLGREISVLDVGTGSGQLARALCGVPGTRTTLCDRDYRARDFCAEHPELTSQPFVMADLTSDNLDAFGEQQFDIVCALGVLHHVPPPNRAVFLRNLGRLGQTVIVADEGIASYQTEAERRTNARIWYGFVIREATRRGLVKLAKLETDFMASDTASARGLHDDFKQSPQIVADQARVAGLEIEKIQLIGPWDVNKGGMFMAICKS